MSRPVNSRAENGPPPYKAAVLYPGKVMHQRMRPAPHRFTYTVFSLLIDLDRLSEADSQSALFSVGRINILSFHRKDHGPRDGSSLRRHIEGLLEAGGLPHPERILLLCYPRFFGYGFNPLSVYYAYRSDGSLSALVYEVRNTFGGLHTYVCPVKPGQISDAGIRQTQDKEFYVSPFIDMDQTYRFRILPPGNTVKVRILEEDRDGPLLSATFSGNVSPLSTKSILSLCLKIPLLTFKVVAAIHWEAFKIWRKRVRFHPRPTGSFLKEPASAGTDAD